MNEYAGQVYPPDQQKLFQTLHSQSTAALSPVGTVGCAVSPPNERQTDACSQTHTNRWLG